MDLIEESRLISDELSLSLPQVLEVASVSSKAKLPFKALSLRESLIHRASELSDTALDLYDSKRFVPTCIMVRALMETTGLMVWLLSRVRSSVESGEVGNVDDFLMKGLMGTRVEGNDIVSLSALSGIDRVAKEEGDVDPGFRDMYDWLCEFTHPNWYGVGGSYSKVDHENFRVVFGKQLDPKSWGFLGAPLYRSLWLFRDYYNGLEPLIHSFIRLCEADLEARGT